LISRRLKAVVPSPTLAINAKAAALAAEGKNVIRLAVGEPDFFTPRNVKDAAIAAIEGNKTTYTPAAGINELKEAVCRKFAEDNGLSYSPKEVMVSVGAKQAIYNAIVALVDPGDEVIIPAPYWVSYPDQVRLAGGEPVIIKTDESTGFKITGAMLRSAVTARSKVLILNSPNNPTGAVYSREELEELAAVIEEHGLCVITDEVYESLVYGQEKHVSIASLSPRVKDRAVVVNGVSKTYCMTGWRIGYAAGPAEVIAAMARLQGHSTSNAASICQYAAVAALDGPKDDLRAMVREYERRRDYMTERINRLPGFSAALPAGAFYVFPNVSGALGCTIAGRAVESAEDLATVILEQALVAVVPGEGFGAPENIRFSYSASMEDIREAMDRIEGLFTCG